MNRQVPEKIAIVGNGKVARHMIHYFELVNQPYTHWFRKTKSPEKLLRQQQRSDLSRLATFKHKLKNLFNHQPQASLAETIEDAAVVMVLIPDDQIESFIEQNTCLKSKTLVHCSGSLITDKALGCHPLMTFGGDLYDLKQYQEIPFVVDEHVDFSSMFPLFDNPVYTIKAQDKVRYHAMCVMAGNFTQMIWREVTKELDQMNLPTHLMSAYLAQNTANFINNPEMSATGPFVRGDVETIYKHQLALAGHPLGEIYQAFYDLHQQPQAESIVQRNQL